VETLVAFFGIARAGLVEVPVNTAYKGAFLDHALGHTDVQVLITEPGLLDLVAALPERPAALRIVVLLSASVPSGLSLPVVEILTWHAMLARGDAGGALPAVGIDDPVGIMLTSGTTGRSKGAVYPSLMPVVAAHEFAVAMETTAGLTPNPTGPFVGSSVRLSR
jgi:carnitine-CoA ligase